MAKAKLVSYSEITTKISGVTHDDPSTGVNRQALIKAYVKPGMELTLKREPDNEYDPNAVGLWFKVRNLFIPRNVHIGYINRTHAAYISQKMKEGVKFTVTVTEVTGGAKDKPTRGVNISIRWNQQGRKL